MKLSIYDGDLLLASPYKNNNSKNEVTPLREFLHISFGFHFPYGFIKPFF